MGWGGHFLKVCPQWRWGARRGDIHPSHKRGLVRVCPEGFLAEVAWGAGGAPGAEEREGRQAGEEELGRSGLAHFYEGEGDGGSS